MALWRGRSTAQGISTPLLGQGRISWRLNGGKGLKTRSKLLKERADARHHSDVRSFHRYKRDDSRPAGPMSSCEAFPEDDGQSDTSDADDCVASDAFDEDDDELRTKLAARRLLMDETEEAIRLSSLETPVAGGPSSSREAATDEQSRLRPRQLLAGTPLDHDEDALSHLMGVMGMRLLMISLQFNFMKAIHAVVVFHLRLRRVLSHVCVACLPIKSLMIR